MVKLQDEYKESWGPNIPCPEVQARLALLNADIRYNFLYRYYIKITWIYNLINKVC